MTTAGERRYGLLDPAVFAATLGIAFLRGLLDDTMPSPPFAEAADVALQTVEEGRIVFTGNPSRRFYNPLGTVHGGWIALLLDTAMGCVVHSSLPAGFLYTTVEMSTVYVRALREEHGPVTCEAVLLHKGRQIASAEAKLFDSERRLIAHGAETCLIRKIAETDRP